MHEPRPASTTTRRGLVGALALYGLAILGDRLDRPVYWVTLGVLSGHTLKHLLAGAAGWRLVRMLREAVAAGGAGRR